MTSPPSTTHVLKNENILSPVACSNDNNRVSRTVVEEEEPEDEDEVVTSHRGGGGGASHPASRASVNAPRHLLDGGEEREGGDDDISTIAGMRAGGSGMVNTVIAERESAYQAKGRRNQMVRLLGGVGVRSWGRGRGGGVF